MTSSACAQCGMSFRNSVHKRKTQFSYHEWVEKIEDTKNKEDILSVTEVQDAISSSSHHDFCLATSGLNEYILTDELNRIIESKISGRR